MEIARFRPRTRPSKRKKKGNNALLKLTINLLGGEWAKKNLRQCRSAVKIRTREGSVHWTDGVRKKYRNAEVKVTAVETDRKGQPRAKVGAKIGT